MRTNANPSLLRVCARKGTGPLHSKGPVPFLAQTLSRLVRLLPAVLIVLAAAGLTAELSAQKPPKEEVEDPQPKKLRKVIDPDDEVGERMEPGKPRIFHDQLQQLPGGFNAAVDPFVRELFSYDQGLVKPQQPLTQVQDAAAKRGGYGVDRCVGRQCHISIVAGFNRSAFLPKIFFAL